MPGHCAGAEAKAGALSGAEDGAGDRCAGNTPSRPRWSLDGARQQIA
jgi:hypothetical protein